MKSIVCLLEESSAKYFLEAIFKRLLPDEIPHKILTFEGKQDLEKQLVRKIQHWQDPDAHFLIMRDQDSGDCNIIKEHLQELVNKTGKQDCSLIRIACKELESFYMGDLKAVEQALEINKLAEKQNKAKFRDPDRLVNTSEEFKKLLKTSMQKVAWARAIAPHLSLDGTNKSTSFNMLISGIHKLLELPSKTYLN